MNVKKAVRFLDEYLELIFGSIFLSGMVVFTFLNIAMRLTMKSTLPWFQELTRYLFVWMVFIAIGAAVRHRSHIRITFLQTRLKKKGRYVVELIVYVVGALFGAICLYYAIPMVQSFSSANMTASSMPWFKMSWLYAVMPVGMALFVFRNLQALVLEVKGYRESLKGGDA